MPGEIVYISIGSNIDPEVHIPRALHLLRDQLVSSFYISEALERPDQPRYRNGVARFSTSLEPEILKREVMRKIERECGRIRSSDRNAPRTLDLDIILYGGRTICTDMLTIPDPAIWEHDFVTIPLLEIAPDLEIPGQNRSVSQIESNVEAATLSRDEALNQRIQEGNTHG